jgi:starch phosphorylase
MKESIRTIAPQFSMARMVKEYTERLYFPTVEEPVPSLNAQNVKIEH